MNNRATLAGIAATSAALLMTELALTRIFSVTMFYHFAFLAISIALFGLSASGVFVYVKRQRLALAATPELLCGAALLHSVATLFALALLVRISVSLNASLDNVVRMLAIYVFAALPFFTGGAVISIAFARLTQRINTLYAADLLGAASGCLLLVPLLNELGAPGVVMSAAGLSAFAAICFAPARARLRALGVAALLVAVPLWLQLAGVAPFDVLQTKGHEGARVLFSKWNSFSRIGVYDLPHGDWSLSPKYKGPLPATLLMDIDASAATSILKNSGRIDDAAHLRYDMSALAYHLAEPGGFSALVIGPGGGRDLLSALLFGARRVDGVEINPIIARDVMLGQFRDFSGGIYANPRVAIHVEDGRSFVRRSPERFDVIQASLVDTWAATTAGAYTLTENSLYTVEAFGEYLDHLTPNGMLTITRWVPDGLRLVSLAQEACAQRGLDAAQHLAIARHNNVITFILKRAPFSRDESERLQRVAGELGFVLIYLPGMAPGASLGKPITSRPMGTTAADYRDLILAPDRGAFMAAYPFDIRPTTDDRPFYFHVTRLRDQFQVAFGHEMLFGNGLSALITLFGISAALVLVFIIGPLLVAAQRPGPGSLPWLAYFAAIGAGFMLLEVALLQRFVLLLGHPVYSLTVTLFSLLLGTGLGSLLGRRVPDERTLPVTVRALLAATLVAGIAAFGLATVLDLVIAWPLTARMALAAALLIPLGMILGMALPGGMRLLDRARPQIVPWAWGVNGAFSVIGATLAVFIAMNWGFSLTLSIAGLVYVLAAAILHLQAGAHFRQLVPSSA